MKEGQLNSGCCENPAEWLDTPFIPRKQTYRIRQANKHMMEAFLRRATRSCAVIPSSSAIMATSVRILKIDIVFHQMDCNSQKPAVEV